MCVVSVKTIQTKSEKKQSLLLSLIPVFIELTASLEEISGSSYRAN